MSMKRLAVISAVGSHNSFHNNSSFYNNNMDKNLNHGLQTMRSGGTNLHGNVNVMLGGAMLSVVITVVCFVCYCCHRNIKKRSSAYRQRWLETDPNMEIYSVEQCYDTSGLFIEQSDNVSLPPSHGPPPSYDMVVALDEIVSRRTNKNCQLHNTTSENYCSFTNNDFKTCSNFREKPDNENFDGCSTDQYYDTRFKTNQPECINGNESNLRSTDSSDIICSLCDKTVSNVCSCNLSNDVNVFIENNNNNHNNNNPIEVNGNCICNDFLRNENLVNVPSTSTHHNLNFYDENFNNNIIDFENCNENGLVRMDMSQIIDNTGLPTYEAALKLESSGYV